MMNYDEFMMNWKTDELGILMLILIEFICSVVRFFYVVWICFNCSLLGLFFLFVLVVLFWVLYYVVLFLLIVLCIFYKVAQAHFGNVSWYRWLVGCYEICCIWYVVMILLWRGV